MFLPIVQRELVLASRRPATYRFRQIAPLFGLICFPIVLALRSLSSPADQGRTFFGILTVILFSWALFAGLRSAVDAISSERRGGTLDLLRLSGLSEIQIVLGNASSGGLRILLETIAAFPLLTIPLMLGGVTPGQVAEAIGVILATLALSLCVALFASSESLGQDEAIRKAIVLLLATLAFGGGVLLFFAQWKFGRGPSGGRLVRHREVIRTMVAAWIIGILGFHMSFGSPAVLLALSLSTARAPEHFVAGWIFSIAVSWVFLWMAGTFPELDPGTAQQETSSLPDPEPETSKPSPRYSSNRKTRRPLLSRHDDPLVWLQALGAPGMNPVLILALAEVAWNILFPTLMNSSLGPGSVGSYPYALIYLGYLPAACTAFFMAHSVTRFYAGLRESGFLELISVCPLSEEHLIGAQKRSFFRLVRIPLVVLAASHLAPLFMPFWGAPRWFYLIWTGIGAIELILYSLAIFWVALYFVMRGQSALGATTRTILLLFVAPGLIVYLLFGGAVRLFAGWMGGMGFSYIVSFFYPVFYALIYLGALFWFEKHVFQLAAPVQTVRSAPWWQAIRNRW